jgi:hypothetical protein
MMMSDPKQSLARRAPTHPFRALVPLAALALLAAGPAAAFRCDGKLVLKGDPAAKVEKYCGEPTSIETRTVLRRPLIPHRLDADRRVILAPGLGYVEVRIEEWLYNLGPYRLMRVVEFENGIVTEVETLGYGYRE